MKSTPPRLKISRSHLLKPPGGNSADIPRDLSITANTENTTSISEVSFHIRSTNPGDWWDNTAYDGTFMTAPSATSSTHSVYLQNLNTGTYEIACNARLNDQKTACSGAMTAGQTATSGGYSYTKCSGTSLVQLEIVSDQRDTTSSTPAPTPTTITPASAIPQTFTIKTHLFVEMPSENNSAPIYRDYKNFTLMFQNQDGTGQKVFCTKNLDTQEFVPKDAVPGLSCTQAHQVTHEGKQYHQFTIQMALNPFNEDLYKQWERYHFYWGVGMDPTEAQKMMHAASQKSIISNQDLAQKYREEKVYVQD